MGWPKICERKSLLGLIDQLFSEWKSDWDVKNSDVKNSDVLEKISIADAENVNSVVD